MFCRLTTSEQSDVSGLFPLAPPPARIEVAAVGPEELAFGEPVRPHADEAGAFG
jgi:hypothetical protein